MTPVESLRLEGISKSFPGVLACRDISLSVGKGEVLALVGENGAGKTTLMNILMGLYQADSGRVLVNGEPVHFHSPRDAITAGLGMVHQRYMLVPGMTVTENVALGYREAWKPARLDYGMVRRRIAEVSERYGLPVDPDAYVWQLSVGEQQRAELVKTLCMGASFLILDEPTSALTPQETDDLIALLKRMTAELSIIFISHKLQEVKSLSDKVAILRRGELVFNGNTADHSPKEIAALMTGREIELPKREAAANLTNEAENYALSIKNLKVKSDRGYYALDNFNLDIRPGEIMGLAGVGGNGQRELAEVINGLRRAESGSVMFFGGEIANRTPAHIIRRGMGYIPEERNTEGIVPSFSIEENFILKDSDRAPWAKGHVLKPKTISAAAETLRKSFDIRGSSARAGSLSGGNIQKVILARELERKPKFLVAVYPTRGLDLGAAEFIHRRLLAKRGEGVGILLISEELEELINLSDRAAVIFKGRIMKVLEHDEMNMRTLGMLMAGVSGGDT